MEENIKVEEILRITKGNLIYGNKNEVCENFCKDTKEINKNDVFIGIKGENFDGSLMYKEALNAGCKGCIINKNTNDKIEKIQNKFIIEVDDSILALQQIAIFKRQKYNIPVIAITGSVGKTSTKDIIASVLSEKYNVLKTQGNMNNHIGLPMTILKLKNHTALVVEMGMNHFGEISNLTNIAKPTIAVITNVGTAHIGNLGSRENILKAKMEILEGLSKNGNVVINGDNDLLYDWYLKNNDKYNVITYGISNNCDEKAKNIKYTKDGVNYTLVGEEKTNINVPVGGEAFVYNSLAAICVGKLLNIKIEKIKEGIKKFQLTQMRLDIQQSKKGYIIINDCYNANYDSMKSAIEYLNNMPGKRKIAVLGDMLELGEYSSELHKKVGNVLVDNKIDILITVGKESKNIHDIVKENDIKAYHFSNNIEAIEKLLGVLQKDDIVLVKASNSMKFKDIVDGIL